MNRNIKGLSEMVKSIFQNWNWPGNVRELKNIIESAFNQAKGEEILLTDVPELIKLIEYKSVATNDDSEDIYSGAINLQSAVENYEKELIQNAIKNTNSLTAAAYKLSITPQRLNYKLAKYKLR